MADELRAKDWSDYIGQDNLKRRLKTQIASAIAQKRPLDHVLLAGEPGFGKTSLAGIIAHALRDPFESFVCPVKPKALSSFFRSWEGGVLLLDEIHRFSKAEQENLLSVLEDGFLQMPNGTKVDVVLTTIIGATTEPHKLIPPLYDRFLIQPRFEDYSDDDMALIVISMADHLGIYIEFDLAYELGRATGGVPRNAKRFVRAIEDLEATNGDGEWDVPAVLDLTCMDPDGLSDQQIDYLRFLSDLGGNAGLTTLATHLNLHPTLVQQQERLLIKRGLIVYGERGRELTTEGNRKVRPQVERERMVG